MAAPPTSEAAAEAAATGESDIFLSYSRRDRAFAQRLHSELVGRGKDVYADWEDIPDWSPDYESDLQEAIRAAHSFVFVLSPDSVASPNCRFELEVAVEEGKRIRPLLRRAVDGEAVPPALRKPQWIDFTAESAFDAALAKLLAAVEVEPEWVRMHTRLLVRARDWEARGREPSLLLRGGDLRAGEAWLGRQAGSEPAPTPLHAEFILAGRRAASRRQRATLAVVVAGLTVAVALAIFALVQRDDAIERERLARSRELAALAVSAGATDPRSSLGLAVEAVEAARTPEAVDALRRTLARPTQLARVEGFAVAAAFLGPEIVRVVCEDGSLRTLTAATRGVRCDDADGPAGLLAAAFSADAGRALLLPRGRPARVVETAGGSVVATLPALAGERWVAGVRLSADGSRVLAVDERGATRLWDLRQPRRPQWRAEGVTAAAFSPDGTLVVTAGRRGAVRVRSASTGAPVAELRGLRDAVEQVDFGRRGRVVASDGTEALLWSVARPGRPQVLPYAGASPTAFAFDRDGSRLAVGASSGEVSVFDTGDPGSTLAEFTGHGGGGDVDRAILDLAFNADSALVVSASAEGTARVWNASNARELAELGRGLGVAVAGAAFAEVGDLVLTEAADGSARLWRVGGAVRTRAVLPLPAGGDARAAVSIAAAGDGTIAAALDDGSIRLWDRRRRATDLTRPGVLTGATEDGRRLVTVGAGIVRIWDPAAKRAVHEIRAPAAMAAALSPDGERVATVDSDMFVRVRSVEGGAPLRRFDWAVPTDPENPSIVVGPRGDRVGVVVGYTASLYDVERGTGVDLPLGAAAGEKVGPVAFSSDADRVVTAAESAALLYDADGHPVAALAGHEAAAGLEGGVTDAVFSPDGALVLTTGVDGTARLWEAGTGAERDVLDAGAPLLAGAFSPDGDVVAATDGTTVSLWSAASGEQLAVVRAGADVHAFRFTPDGAAIVTGEVGRVRVVGCAACGPVDRVLALARRQLAGAG